MTRPARRPASPANTASHPARSHGGGPRPDGTTGAKPHPSRPDGSVRHRPRVPGAGLGADLLRRRSSERSRRRAIGGARGCWSTATQPSPSTSSASPSPIHPMQVFYDLRAVAASRGDDAPAGQPPTSPRHGDRRRRSHQRRRRARVPKPDALQDLPPACERLFDRLRRWFDVDDSMTVDLSTIAGAQITAEPDDPYLIAGFTMHRLQACTASQPGVAMTTDVIVTTIDAVPEPRRGSRPS